MADKPAVPVGYKQTEVGVIPEDWCASEVGKHITFIGGSQPDKSHFRLTHKPGYCRLIQIRDYKSDNFTVFVPENLARRFCDENDIMIGRYGPPVFQILRGLKGAYNVALIKAAPNESLDREFAYYFLSQDTLFKFIDKLSRRSSGQTGVDLQELRSYPLFLPATQEEQRAIATALGDFDALLKELDRLITKKRDIKQATMQQLLTGQTRLPGFEGEWQEKQLGQLGHFLKGSGVKRDESQTGSLPCVRYGEIYTLHHDIIRKFYSWISEPVAQTAVRIQKGDVLFAGSGETKEEIGKSVAISGDVEAYAGGDIVILRNNGLADPTFLGYALNQPAINAQKARFGQGDAVVHISASSLSQVTLHLPSLEEQEAISLALWDMDIEIDALKQCRAKTAALKQAMMQELLTGRTRLTTQGQEGVE
jgi:type I restriction enzyme S subunit